VNVRDRFLDPQSLPNPRTINPDISPRVADAILWAMELHPDNRPAEVAEFMKALTGESSRPLWTGQLNNGHRQPAHLGEMERRLLAVAASLGFLTLLLTLLRNL